MAAVAAPARIDRLLLGEVDGAAEARIRIAAGTLAGAEIRLTVAGAHAVTAQLLTPGAGSRETLSMVMEEIRRRLRDKGIAVLAPSAGDGDGRGTGRSRADTGSGDRWPTGR
ncbi:MAG TPA: hypothetical protein VKZ18_09725 [Polyangia bacterium]|nr:hypothetical protein [Polyangia bacterium]